MKIFKELKKLGYKHYTEHTVEELDNLPLESKERIMEQALVLRWFREKHGLVGIIKFGTNDFTYNVYNEDGMGLLTKESLNFNSTYEETKLACLKKLIELCKKKYEK
jgi:hypothetical protein